MLIMPGEYAALTCAIVVVSFSAPPMKFDRFEGTAYGYIII
jgi:hypothetical protein